MKSVILYHGSGREFHTIRALDCLKFERSERIHG